MQFLIGAAVLLSSMGLLAALTRISARNRDFILLRGDFLPAMTSVAISTGMTVGLLVMGFSGQAYFTSTLLEVAVLAGFTVLSGLAINRLADLISTSRAY